MSHKESEPKPTIQERILIDFGYEGRMNDTLPDRRTGRRLLVRNFLDAYGDSPHRQQTEDLMRAYLGAPDTDPRRQAIGEVIELYLKIKLGPPEPNK